LRALFCHHNDNNRHAFIAIELQIIKLNINKKEPTINELARNIIIIIIDCFPITTNGKLDFQRPV
jgi:hypothetical protein